MLCEGMLLYILLIRVFHEFSGKHWKFFNFIGWGMLYMFYEIREVGDILRTNVDFSLKA